MESRFETITWILRMPFIAGHLNFFSPSIALVQKNGHIYFYLSKCEHTAVASEARTPFDKLKSQLNLEPWTYLGQRIESIEPRARIHIFYL